MWNVLHVAILLLAIFTGPPPEGAEPLSNTGKIIRELIKERDK